MVPCRDRIDVWCILATEKAIPCQDQLYFSLDGADNLIDAPPAGPGYPLIEHTS
jgi:hypothetical protein